MLELALYYLLKDCDEIVTEFNSGRQWMSANISTLCKKYLAAQALLL